MTEYWFKFLMESLSINKLEEAGRRSRFWWSIVTAIFTLIVIPLKPLHISGGVGLHLLQMRQADCELLCYLFRTYVPLSCTARKVKTVEDASDTQLCWKKTEEKRLSTASKLSLVTHMASTIIPVGKASTRGQEQSSQKQRGGVSHGVIDEIMATPGLVKRGLR